MLVVETPVINSYPLMNQALINEVWNFFVFKYNLEKINQINEFYTLYHELGGNSNADNYYEKVKALDIKDDDDAQLL